MKTILELLAACINLMVAIFGLLKLKRVTLKTQNMTEKMFTICAIVIFGVILLAAICYVFKQK